MFARMEIGRIAGIPIYLDMMFVLVLLIFSYPYFTAGNTQLMSAGFIIIIGLLLSILLHELGHAFAGRLFSAHVSHIELTGLGGVAHFERSLPRSALRALGHLSGGTGGQSAAVAGPGHAGRSGGRRRQSDGRPAAGRAVLQQLPADVLQPAARLSRSTAATRSMRGSVRVIGGQWATRIVACLGLVGRGRHCLPGVPERHLPHAGRTGDRHGQLAGVAESGRWRR